jgi:hypothetical protein
MQKDPQKSRRASSVAKKTIKFDMNATSASHEEDMHHGQQTDEMNSSSEDLNSKAPNQLLKGIKSKLHNSSNVPYVIGAHVVNNNKGFFDQALLFLSWLIMAIFFPFSLFLTLKVVQEYE